MKANTAEKSGAKRKINWALPNQTVTHEEFMDSIREAEKGPFYTFEEMKTLREQWRNSKKSL
jgi:hypothetical protein